MKRPWQIWTLFAVALMLVIPPMVWLTIKAVQVDRQREVDRNETELARQEAELQERLSSALYRLDLKLLPLVAQEAARPHYLYDSFYQSPFETTALSLGNNRQPDDGKKTPTVKEKNAIDDDAQLEMPNTASSGDLQVKIPSPLMLEPPEFVKLHFQIDADGMISSPQQPLGAERDFAIACCGLPKDNTVQAEQISQASSNFDYGDVYFRCATVEPKTVNEVVITNQQGESLDNAVSQNAVPTGNAYQVPAIDKFVQNLEDQKRRVSPRATFDNKLQQQVIRNSARVNEEFSQRQESTRAFSDRQWVANNQQMSLANPVLGEFPASASPYANVRSGAMQPMWVGEQLILARRVELDQKSIVQVCWLDWTAIEDAMNSEVSDLLPEVRFVPINEENELNVGTALTTLPVQLIVDNSSALSTLALDSKVQRLGLPGGFSGLTLSLLVAWLALGLATVASAFLLHGVLKMSERRATFVSAVTHELRTPLTTFRMYAEMLAEKMVPEEKTHEYANTLRIQADRLSHLVENVLQFAKLERGSQTDANESLLVESLIDRFKDRLIERAEQEEMKLVVQISQPVLQTLVTTQPGQIEQVLFNLVDNASKYAKPSSNGTIELSVELSESTVEFRVRDYGPGVAKKYRKRMFQPFCKSDQDAANSAPGVGLGLALCRRMATALKGQLYLEDCDDGACFVLELPRGSAAQ
ncbi:MAG: HAMP domain-containing sensor histidine kinase [Planctomycetota bacterium]